MVCLRVEIALGRDGIPCNVHGYNRERLSTGAPTPAGLGPPLFAAVPGSGLNDLNARG
jgi:hypothetical protein